MKLNFKRTLNWYAKQMGVEYSWLRYRYSIMKQFELPLTDEEMVILKKEWDERSRRGKKTIQPDNVVIEDKHEELKDK